MTAKATAAAKAKNAHVRPSRRIGRDEHGAPAKAKAEAVELKLCATEEGRGKGSTFTG
jgi:hypothetical protein